MSNNFKIERLDSYQNTAYCKLTDSLSKSFEIFTSSNIFEPPRLTIKDGKGTIQIPQNKSYSFSMEPITDNGITTCLFTDNKFFLTGRISCKLNVEATADSIAKTMKRIEEVQGEVKQNCIKELKRPLIKVSKIPTKRPLKTVVLPPKVNEPTSIEGIIIEDLPPAKTDIKKSLKDCLKVCLKTNRSRKEIYSFIKMNTKIDVNKNKRLINRLLDKADKKTKNDKFVKYRNIKFLQTEQQYVACGRIYKENYENYRKSLSDLKKVKEKYVQWMDELKAFDEWTEEAQIMVDKFITSFGDEINEQFYEKVKQADKLHENMAHIWRLIYDFENNT